MVDYPVRPELVEGPSVHGSTSSPRTDFGFARHFYGVELLITTLFALEIGLGLIILVKQTLARLHRLVNGLNNVLALFILAKELLADEEHSNAEAVALDVLVVPVTGANLLAILYGIAAQGHSRTIPIPVINLVLGQPLLYQFDNFRLREKFVWPALHVLLGKCLGTLERLVEGQLSLQLVPPRGNAMFR